MFVIAGALIVVCSVIGGFLMEKGNPSLLFQPAELVIILGSAIGAFFIASPPRVVKVVAKNITLIISSKEQSKEKYLEILSLLYQLLSKIRKEGLISIESDIEAPDKSTIFNRYKSVMTNLDIIKFLCDNLKVIITTNVPPHELDDLMEVEIETNHHEAMVPSRSIAKIADALPGLGIVAAVLGVVLTMGKIDESPEVLGHSVGAALVGTFLGVLLCYGFAGPMATNLEHKAREDSVSLQIVKRALVAFVGGLPPQIAVEFARRVIPGKEKPSFDELEKEIRGR